MVRPDHFEGMRVVKREVQRRELAEAGGSFRDHRLGGFQKRLAQRRLDVVLLPCRLNDRIQRRASGQHQESSAELPCYSEQRAVILRSWMPGR